MVILQHYRFEGFVPRLEGEALHEILQHIRLSAPGHLPEAPWEEDQVRAGSEEDTTETLPRSAGVSRHQVDAVLVTVAISRM
ncbi:unnamed protein product [Closterium sp. Naga37s-1]|nr:unnamed protein product [Closterium sp. Naga37s-1]